MTALPPEVVDRAAARYASAGRFDFHFVKGKLAGDPLYRGIVESVALPTQGRLVDVGCGRGILLALLAEARGVTGHRLELHGIEPREAAATVARTALRGDATIVRGHAGEVAIPECSVVTILDVLHYLDEAEQDRLIDRASAALSDGGLLLLREADAAAGWPFWAVRLGERFAAIARGDLSQRFHWRTATAWRMKLERAGFEVTVRPMGAGTPFANLLFEGRRKG
ncbi:MAG TPA: methyltransferase domain-containing protein [Candidatus Polarisedimenticolaceae bacterium]